jgi:hypothetical protein
LKPESLRRVNFNVYVLVRKRPAYFCFASSASKSFAIVS